MIEAIYKSKAIGKRKVLEMNLKAREEQLKIFQERNNKDPESRQKQPARNMSVLVKPPAAPT